MEPLQATQSQAFHSRHDLFSYKVHFNVLIWRISGIGNGLQWLQSFIWHYWFTSTFSSHPRRQDWRTRLSLCKISANAWRRMGLWCMDPKNAAFVRSRSYSLVILLRIFGLWIAPKKERNAWRRICKDCQLGSNLDKMETKSRDTLDFLLWKNWAHLVHAHFNNTCETQTKTTTDISCLQECQRANPEGLTRHKLVTRLWTNWAMYQHKSLPPSRCSSSPRYNTSVENAQAHTIRGEHFK